MKPRTVQSLLDAIEFSDELMSYTHNIALEQYLSDRLRRLAVERLLEVVGEALSRGEKSEPDLANEVPELRAVIGMRNRIAHGYDDINDRLIWSAATTEIPALRNRLVTLLESAGEWPVK